MKKIITTEVEVLSDDLTGKEIKGGWKFTLTSESGVEHEFDFQSLSNGVAFLLTQGRRLGFPYDRSLVDRVKHLV